jgi:hypothetical protein
MNKTTQEPVQVKKTILKFKKAVPVPPPLPVPVASPVPAKNKTILKLKRKVPPLLHQGSM